MNALVARPLSRKDIRGFARYLRKAIGMDDRQYINIVDVVEVVLAAIDPELNFVIAPMEEMGNLHGLTDPATKTIRIREDVYCRACEGHGRDRFTIAHELGHYLMHDEISVGLARVNSGEKIITYRDPEWQADAFAGEFLMPHHQIKGLSAKQIARSYGVSLAAAELQRRK